MKSILLLSYKVLPESHEQFYPSYELVRNSQNEKLLIFSKTLHELIFAQLNCATPLQKGMIQFVEDQVNAKKKLVFTEKEFREARAHFLEDKSTFVLPTFEEIERDKKGVMLQHKEDPNFFYFPPFRHGNSGDEDSQRNNYHAECLHLIRERLSHLQSDALIHLVIHAKDIYTKEKKNSFSQKNVDKFLQRHSMVEIDKDRLSVAVFSHDDDYLYDDHIKMITREKSYNIHLFRAHIEDTFLLLDRSPHLFDSKTGVNADDLNRLKSIL